MSLDRVDSALDAVLRASGSALRNYTMPSSRESLRKAMMEAMQPGHELACAVEAYFAGECPRERVEALASDVLNGPREP